MVNPKLTMTVQQLINKLQEVEDKSAVVVTTDYEYGLYNLVDEICYTTIPVSLDMDDDQDGNVKSVNAVII